MKKFSLFFAFVLSLSFTSNAFAGTTPTANSSELVRKEVLRMIDTPELSKHGIYEQEVPVTFSIDQDGRIVLEGVATEDAYLKEFIQKSLSNRKVQTKDLEVGAVYNITFLFLSEKA
ncbi:MAG TPA: hypothetical protein PKA00_09125 [Saprospiraceae bacterium]|nr:hypothetical protein [Saprospiraceae bacterium]HMQ83058.1 hypothetical protein [Saprospiraceae bacterium]